MEIFDKRKTVGIYCRLSRDDGSDSESNSITSQKLLLSAYANKNNFVIYNTYVDDGISGVTFERPGFIRMIEDISAKKIDIVLCKDLSRLGRDNALVAYYTEHFFPENRVRFIALIDGIDTVAGDNEIMPFKSILNEFYARDISKKVKSAMMTRAANGEYMPSIAPYGYVKSDIDNRLVIDEEAAGIVKRIYKMISEGRSAFYIAKLLTAEGVLTPKEYKAYKKNSNSAVCSNGWSQQTIFKIARNSAYTGTYTYNKTSKLNFKSKKRIMNDKNDWIVIENAFEPIISKELFEIAQREVRIKHRILPNDSNIFRGIVKCPDCGCSLSFSSAKSNGGSRPGYCCNNYRQKTKNACLSHYISYDKLYKIVLGDIKRIFESDQELDENIMNEKIKESFLHYSLKKSDDKQRELKKYRNRHGEIELIIKKLIEKNAIGNINDEEYGKYYREYAEEKENLESKIDELEKSIDKKNSIDPLSLEGITKRYIHIKKLDREIINLLIDKIYVHQAVKEEGGARRQSVEINYKFIKP